MAKKKEIDENIKEIKASVQAGTALIGKESVVKGLQSGSVQRVFFALNCPASTREDVAHYASLVSVELVDLEQNNEELGVLCKKNFFISVLGISGE